MYIDSTGWNLNYPKASLPTCHLQLIFGWQCFNLVIITIPTVPFQLEPLNFFRGTSPTGVYFENVSPKWSFLAIRLRNCN